MASPSVAVRFLERLCAAAERVQLRRNELCDQQGLGEPRRRALNELASRGDAGCSQTELATALGLADSSLCGLVDRMQQEGLLFRFRSKADRRKSLLMLTREGRARLTAATNSLEEHFCVWLQTADDNNLELLGNWLDDLARNIDTPPATAPRMTRHEPSEPQPGDRAAWKEAG